MTRPIKTSLDSFETGLGGSRLALGPLSPTRHEPQFHILTVTDPHHASI